MVNLALSGRSKVIVGILYYVNINILFFFNAYTLIIGIIETDLTNFLF